MLPPAAAFKDKAEHSRFAGAQMEYVTANWQSPQRSQMQAMLGQLHEELEDAIPEQRPEGVMSADALQICNLFLDTGGASRRGRCRSLPTSRSCRGSHACSPPPAPARAHRAVYDALVGDDARGWSSAAAAGRPGGEPGGS